ncbi:hypothetical protein CLOBY_18270 [Clostridium saccharobutylicum]|uniref:hypothetical protein n=1 Tax=Clostridium saccharobutylicum TaxID=169679 RepID=UPI000983E47F|nr:hypothetical protein [Clostridium saccharobutylicum]AQS09696.1 hypothetical protein CLOBY_18270 [Clostridium saccharobutylicum]MBC2436910.1 hypothetical protein [Clostridium saccharobutylicum]NSB89258.1 hypothetical protein [Clostridium saccharobutylicum]NYC27912.1 hypothetical protein [Clostridium saccharobutylicum]OOM17109.1 hypothetical protein CLSAB_20570 [Clostridium saccharobutylicum]
MTEEQKQILLDLEVKEEEMQNYYFSEDKGLFTPSYDKDNNMIKTGEEVYKDYIDSMNNPVTPQPTADEILRAKLIQDNANMQLQLAQQQQINSSLLTQIAKLGGTQ